MNRAAPTDTRTTRPAVPAFLRGRWRVFFVSWLLLTGLMSIWAITTPVSGSPDEPAHMVKAASVVRGQFIGENSPSGHQVQVPAYIGETTDKRTCFAFQNKVSATCQPAPAAESNATVTAPTTAGLYNPVYYLLVGWPTLIFTDTTGIYAMRIVSVALTSLFMAFAISCAATWRVRRYAMMGVLIGATPVFLFLGAAVNPNAVEASSLFAVFVGMLTIITQRTTPPSVLMERGIAVAIAGMIGVNTRGLSALWLAIAVLAPLILLSGAQLLELIRKRIVIITAILVALGSAFAILWLLSSNVLGAGIDDTNLDRKYPLYGQPWWMGFRILIMGFFDYSKGIVGLFGWLDTPAPEPVYFLWATLTGGVFILAMAVLRGRKLIMATTLTALFILLPAIIQGMYITGGGLIWQGRYNLPLFMMLFFTLTVGAGEYLQRAPAYAQKRASVIVVIALGLAHLYAFTEVLRRFTTGLDTGWPQALRYPEWKPPLGTIPGLGIIPIICTYALALAVTLWFCLRIMRTRPTETVTPEVADADTVDTEAPADAALEPAHATSEPNATPTPH
ncbi:hypothetical protein GCM10022198_09980 [Klugiella xanthotipulae]|uniref:Putative membrane protein DUF2142 n=1 Tax=Klugiella xanthotipulae TaxID=244735 RepID=A0A543HYG4_9MICO|nr:DUF2142 domain-containing protein [Klugiella xanthotipulae]TQM63396.1 putative membrane protein DUF2142 [Klugiella xanthotipulae]